MNLYTQLKNSQHERLNSFLKDNAFFAFSEKQFQDGIKKLGIKESEKGRLTRIGDTGGFLLSEKARDYVSLTTAFIQEIEDAVNNPETGADFAYQMFYSELANHEYGYTGDTTETLEALGYTPQDIMSSPTLKKALERAATDLTTE